MRANLSCSTLYLTVAAALGCGHSTSTPTPNTTTTSTATASADPFRGARGCFLLHEIGSNDTTERGGAECAERTTPASTFKIPNALIGLDTKVVSGEEHPFKWDGKKRWNERWNKDHTLATAMRHSVVWAFQDIAREVKSERYRDYLAKFRYGNADPSGEVTMFWLNGTLVISPREQLAFVEALYTDKLPVDPKAMAIVKHTLEMRGEAAAEVKDRFPFLDQIPSDVVFSGKTGTEDEAKKADGTMESIGWFVGSVEKQGKRWVFATRIRSEDKKRGGAEAARIAYELLREQKVL